MGSVPYFISLDSQVFSCDAFRVRRLRLREAISTMFELDLDVVFDGPGPDRPGLIGKSVIVLFSPIGAEGTPHRIHGNIVSFEEDLDGPVGSSAFSLRIVPRAWALTAVETSETYVDTDVPKLVLKKLEHVGFDHNTVFRLVETYDPRPFVAQYLESDFHFVSRLIEHVGISYFFEHAEDATRIVFTDHAGGFAAPFPTALPRLLPNAPGVGVHALRVRRTIAGRHYSIHDYDCQAPLVELSGDHEMAAGLGGGIVEFGSHPMTQAEATRLARVRAEECHALAIAYEGSSNDPRLHAGQRVRIEAGGRHEPLELCIVRVDHRATQVVAGFDDLGDSYENTFVAIPAERTFRPARVTPKPRIPGVVTGTIAPELGAEPGAYASIDAFGRYRVRFHFDTQHAGETNPSAAVRMLQNHAGAGYGTHFPLKPGTEVAIAFIGGDPDRPVIVGAVPNALTPSPVTAQNRGVHRIQTSQGVVIDLVE